MSGHEELMNNGVHRLKDGQESCHAWIRDSPAHFPQLEECDQMPLFQALQDLEPGCVVDA